jgi:GH15 family glucan-1,4-alpha-glucosidase
MNGAALRERREPVCMPSRIEDYALIGDCDTAALVTRDGSIDWLCWPRFDSGACFAALLGSAENGRWLIAPTDPTPRITRRYRDGTLILETQFETAEGAVTLIDFMPLRGVASDLVRLVVGLRGQVTMRTELVLRLTTRSSPMTRCSSIDTTIATLVTSSADCRPRLCAPAHIQPMATGVGFGSKQIPCYQIPRS